ncbi:hypothetical protein YC2023_057536 [Brassica napus]
MEHNIVLTIFESTKTFFTPSSVLNVDLWSDEVVPNRVRCRLSLVACLTRPNHIEP